MYRAIAVYLCEKWVDLDAVSAANIEWVQIDFNNDHHVCINGEEYESKIRTPDASMWASKIASQGTVRWYVIAAGQLILSSGNYVLEWRDTGTIWSPWAQLKFYLTADPVERAHRRFLDLQKQWEDITEAEVLEQIIARDYRDMNREYGPLLEPEGAHVVDTTHLTIPEQVEKIYTIVQETLQNVKTS